MDVFGVLGSNAIYSLTREKYESVTGKVAPYYQFDNKGRRRHYAKCPECGNPTIIVNLYGETRAEDYTERKNFHARHAGRSVNGFPPYDRDAYDTCPLSNYQALGTHRVKRSHAAAKEFQEYIEKHYKQIKREVQNIIGFNVSDTYFKCNLFDPFIKTNEFLYKSVHKYNIPYAILYVSQELNMYGQFLNLRSESGKSWKPYLEEAGCLVDRKVEKVSPKKYVKITVKAFLRRRENNQVLILKFQCNEKIVEREINMKSIILDSL